MDEVEFEVEPSMPIRARRQVSEQFEMLGDADSPPAPLAGMVRVYHAQTHVVPGVLVNREVKTYNSMGTWFTSDPEVDRQLYGGNVTAYDIPHEGYLEPKDDFLIDTLGHCLPLIREHLGPAAAAHLQEHPWGREGREQRQALKDRMQSETFIPDRRRQAMRMQLNALDRSSNIVRAAILSQDYCRGFRDMIEGAGYRGFLWRASNIDGMGPHDVYLLFHSEDIQPVARVYLAGPAVRGGPDEMDPPTAGYGAAP